VIEKILQYKKFIAALIGAGAVTGHEAIDNAADAALGVADGATNAVLAFVTAAAVAALRNHLQVPDIEYDEIDGLDQDDEYVAAGE